MLFLFFPCFFGFSLFFGDFCLFYFDLVLIASVLNEVASYRKTEEYIKTVTQYEIFYLIMR